jgi:uncharacterized GH25 family protein
LEISGLIMIDHVLRAAAVMVALSVVPAFSHEFIVKPSAASAKANETLAATVFSSHVFIKSEEIEAADVTTAFICQDGKRTPIALTADPASLVYKSSFKAPTDKTFVLCGVRGAIDLATLPEGSKPGTRKDFPNAKLVRRIEKFSKAFVNANADDTSWSKPIGDRLEIMLNSNPVGIKAGDEVPVRVLYDGKPLATKLYATYDGFSSRPMAFAFYAEMDAADAGYVKFSHPGTWIVRVEHNDDVKTADIDRYMARAVMVLEVK